MNNIYISGKVTGFDMEATERKFQEAEDIIVSLGYRCLNPIKLVKRMMIDSVVNIDDRKEIMRRLISEMVWDCDAIYMLNDWQGSEGAVQEYEVARIMGMKALHQCSKDLEKI